MPAPAFCKEPECHSKDLNMFGSKMCRRATGITGSIWMPSTAQPLATKCHKPTSRWHRKNVLFFRHWGRCGRCQLHSIFLPSFQDLFTKRSSPEPPNQVWCSATCSHMIPTSMGRTGRVGTHQVTVGSLRSGMRIRNGWHVCKRKRMASVVRFRQCTVYETHCHIPAAEIPEHVARVDLCAELILQKKAQAQANHIQQKLG